MSDVLGTFEQAVLLALVRLEKDAFTAANRKRWRIEAFLRERMPEMEVGGTHDLLECPAIKMLLIYIKQRGAINALQERDVADDANIAVVFDSAAIL